MAGSRKYRRIVLGVAACAAILLVGGVTAVSLIRHGMIDWVYTQDEAILDLLEAKSEANDRVFELYEKSSVSELNYKIEIGRLNERLASVQANAAATWAKLEEAEKQKEELVNVLSELRRQQAAKESMSASDIISAENAEARDWESRFKYAAYKYNKLIQDYDRLQKRYIELVGFDGGKNGIVTGAELYKALKASNDRDLKSLDDLYRGGIKTSKMKEWELHKKELEGRGQWIKETAKALGIVK